MYVLAVLAVLALWATPTAAQTPSSVAQPIADITVTGTATVIKLASADTYAVSCTNTHATVHVRWGNASVTATTGQRIPALAAAEIRTRSDIYMISEGANVVMACTVEKQ